KNDLIDSALLSNLLLSAGALSPSFSPDVMSYTVEVALPVQSVTVTATTSQNGSTIKINGTEVVSGTASTPILLNLGTNSVSLDVTLAGMNASHYVVEIHRGSRIDYVKASDSAKGDQFGGSVSLSGNTLAVGALARMGATGAVYVFTRSGTTWS